MSHLTKKCGQIYGDDENHNINEFNHSFFLNLNQKKLINLFVHFSLNVSFANHKKLRSNAPHLFL